MNKLVEEIIKPILEANTKIKKVIGIYGGRFQPFGPHHYKTYQWLQKQVDDAYISTSNIKKPPRHPMNFKEKVRHMTKVGVPKSKIIEEKTPYVAKNLQKKFNKDTTAFVYVFGAKDAGRLGGSGKYYKDYKKNKNNLVGYEEHGYYLVAPHVSISVGGKEVSGTTMRELLGSDKYDDKERAKLFKKMFGYYDKGVFQMMTNKFKKLFEINEGLPTKVTDKYKKVKSNPQSEFGDDFKKHHQYHNASHIDGMGAEDDTYDFDDENDDNEGGLQKDKDKSKRGYEPVKEDSEVIPYSKTKKKPKDPKWFDGKHRDLLKGWLEEGVPPKVKKVLGKYVPANVISNNTKLIGWIQKNPQLINQLIRLATEGVNEGVDLPIKVGDTIRMGKFKNKKVVIKSIDWSEKGDLLINGRPALKFRIEKSKEIDEFLIHNDIRKIIQEISSTANTLDANDESDTQGLQAVDSGPSAMMGGMRGYSSRNKVTAEKIGWSVLDYILKVDVDNVPPNDSDMLSLGWPFGPHKSVSYLPAGIGTGITPNNQENLTGRKGYNKWLRNIRAVAQEVGMELMKFRQKDKDVVKQMAKDATDTLKKQKEEEKEKEVSIKVEENVFSKEWWKKELLTEGGAYGHMAHPFDDKDLTFGDLKKIIELGLGGNLSREDGVTEKLDGQNIMVSWKDGKLIAARNKGHIKNGGKTALTKGGIKSKFKGRGDIADAFNFAMDDLEKAIKTLSDKQKEKIFNNGYNFMNLEVMWPKSANVIDYDKAELVFHGALRYNDAGVVTGEVKGSGRMLAGMIKQRNKNIGKKYKIGKPVFLDVPKHQDFGAKKDKFIGKLNKLKNTYALKDADTLALYHQSYWEEYIYNAAQQFGYTIPNKVLKNLTKRWAFFDKSYKVPKIKKDLEKQPKFLEWVLTTDKNDHTKMVKENMKPFETLFFAVGAEILKNVKGYMAANPNKTVQGIRKKLNAAISGVKAGGDKKKLNTLKLQLDKLNKIGGVDAIVPSEGIVFKYKGKTYKFTGAFAPINQITGLISF